MKENRVMWVHDDIRDMQTIKMTDEVKIAEVDFENDKITFPIYRDIPIKVLRKILNEYDDMKKGIDKLKELKEVEIEYR